jgi:predicted dehydrogenase
MNGSEKRQMTRRAFAGATATAFMIVPRHVLGAPFVPPSDKITLATVGLGRQGQAVTMSLLARPEIQVVSVCDVNRGSKDYMEYGSNALLVAARRLLGAGYENWAEDLASPGKVQLTHEFESSLGMGGREPAKRLVEAYYSSRKDTAYHGCTAYSDYRELLSKEKDLDAVYVATPDHWHAPISIAAMRQHKHVLCQKPMSHSIPDAHRMAATAREMNVATSLPVNNPSSESTRLIASWIADGAIGPVREVHNWSSRPYWPQGVDRPKEVQPVPDGFDWDMWLGPAPERPYNKAYLPFAWRGWFDFGCGSFGDMGCYSFAGVFKILDLTPPLSVEACASESYEETYPKASIVHLNYPARGDKPPVHMAWYDGGLRPPRPAGIGKQDDRYFQKGESNEGILYVGDKGIILAGFNGDRPKVYPENPKYQTPPSRQRGGGNGGGAAAAGGPPRDAAIDQWIGASKGGAASLTNFETQCPVSEAFLLGCLSQRFPGERFEWDSANVRVTNSEKANKYLDQTPRSAYKV